MRTYTHLVNKQFKLNKKRTFLCVLGILIGVAILTFSFLYFKYISLNNLKNTENSYGKWEVAYNLNNNYDYRLNILENNVLIKNFGIIQMKNFQKNVNDKDIDIKYLGFNQEVINNILINSLQHEGIYKYFPLKDNDVLINERAKALGFNVGDMLSLGNQTYKIIGFYNNSNLNDSIEVIGNMDKNIKNSSITAYVQVKGDSTNILNNIDTITKNLGINTKVTDLYNNNVSLQVTNDINNEKKEIEINKIYLGDAYKIDGTGQKETYIFELLTILTISIVVLLMNIIIVSFLTKERVKTFSILKCMGATPKQVYSILVKELIIIASFAIPSGIILGYSIFIATTNILFKFNEEFWNITLKNEFCWQSIGLVALISLIILIVAGIVSINKLSNIGIITKTKATFKTFRVSRNTTKFIRKISGVKGEILYKDIKAKKALFLLTTALLILIFILIVVSTCFLSSYSTYEKSNIKFKKDIDVSLGTNISNDNLLETFTRLNVQKQDFLNELYSVNAKDITSILQISIPNNCIISFMYTNKDGFKKNWAVIDSNINLYIYNDEAFRQIENNINKGENLKNNLTKEIILVKPSYSLENKNKEEFFKNIKAGDFLNIEMFKNDDNQGKGVDIKAKVFGTISNENMINTSIKTENSIDLIVSKEFVAEYYKKIFKELNTGIPIEQKFEFNITGNEKEKLLKSNKIKNYISVYTDGYMTDNIIRMKKLEESIKMVSDITYLGIGILVVLGCIFIFIDKMIVAARREKMFGTIIALGGEKSMIKSILWIEVIIQAFISIIISIPLSLIILSFLDRVFLEGVYLESMNKIFWKTGTVTSIFIILLLIVITLFISKKINESYIRGIIKIEE